MGANSLGRAKGYFGEFFRRLPGKLGTAQAITATATQDRAYAHRVLRRNRASPGRLISPSAEMRLRKQSCSNSVLKIVPNIGYGWILAD
jgi:hypothetical protein